jgi:hypothetical protein
MSDDVSTRTAAMHGWRRPASLLVGAIVVVALALPVLAADPSADPSAGASVVASESASAQPSPQPSPSPEPSTGTAPSAAASVAPRATPPRAFASASPGPDESADTDEDGQGNKGNKGNKGDKTPEVPITLRGTIAMSTDGKGRPSFSLTAGGKTYELEAGPPWFWGANNPLAKFAGKTVTVTGETHTGATDVDVLTVDGTVIRAPGKPPWAGGWKANGEKHPGWSQEKADKFQAKHGGCWPPGHCKADAPTSSPAIPRGD